MPHRRVRETAGQAQGRSRPSVAHGAPGQEGAVAAGYIVEGVMDPGLRSLVWERAKGRCERWGIAFGIAIKETCREHSRIPRKSCAFSCRGPGEISRTVGGFQFGWAQDHRR